MCRLPVSLLAAFSAATGYMLISPSGALSRAWVPALAVFLLAAGASALNQVQERATDALMERTKNRPLPSGRIGVSSAVTFAMVLMLCGLSLQLWVGGFHPSSFILHPFLLGLLALLWYNGLYTPLKRRSAFAAVPGALVGALPPAIGWSMGGGSLTAPPLLALMAFMFLWQVPHFWLIVLKREEEYRRAGFPLPTDRIAPARFRAIVLSWMAAASLVALTMPLIGPLRNPLLFGSVLAAVLVMAWLGARILSGSGAKAAGIRASFSALNAFAFLVLILSAAGHLMDDRAKFKGQSSKSEGGAGIPKLETRNPQRGSSGSQRSILNSQLAEGKAGGDHV